MASLIPQINTAPKPDFFFLWLYGVLSLMPDYMETVVMLTALPLSLPYYSPFHSCSTQARRVRAAGQSRC